MSRASRVPSAFDEQAEGRDAVVLLETRARSVAPLTALAVAFVQSLCRLKSRLAAEYATALIDRTVVRATIPPRRPWPALPVTPLTQCLLADSVLPYKICQACLLVDGAAVSGGFSGGGWLSKIPEGRHHISESCTQYIQHPPSSVLAMRP